jgi:hypothetical protein
MRTVPSARERSDHPALLGVEAELELAGRDGAPPALARPAGRRLGRGALPAALPDVVDAVWPAVSVTVLAPPAALRPALGRARWTAYGWSTMPSASTPSRPSAPSAGR